jgi:glycosyltransferase involved in cell wall biosynthesis
VREKLPAIWRGKTRKYEYSDMRIGIDGGSWSNRRGYGRYLREIAQALSKAPAEHQYVLFLDDAGADQYTELDRFETRIVPLSQQIGTAASSDGARSLMDLARMGRAVSKEHLDMFFFPTVYSYFPLWRRIPTIVGIHDTIADRNPQLAFAGKRQELFWNLKVKMAIRSADLIMTVSGYSRRCLESFLRVPGQKIRVVSEAASARFHPPREGAARELFVLYVGGISPNKNLATLIRAFGLCEARRAGWRLLLAGDYQSDGFRGCYQELSELVQDQGLTPFVDFLGYVTDDELVDLYQRAGLFVMPSFDEGFGLPAVEAMASGVPVIASAGNALAELVGDAGICVETTDVRTFASQMDRVALNPDLQKQMSESGIARAALFTWKQSALDLLQLFDEAAICRA